MQTTLLLDQSTWDLLVDVNLNIAIATNPYSLVQDASSAIRTFEGELYYDITQGVPYWGNILGQLPSLAYVKSRLQTAALSVPTVIAAQCFITGLGGIDRQLQGQVQITDDTGVIVGAAF